MASTLLPETAEIAPGGGGPGEGKTPEPGVVVLFASGKPTCAWLPLASGQLELGRAALMAAGVDDLSVSRSHAQIVCDGPRWVIRDLGSRNGTFVGGARITELVTESTPVVRLGRAITMAVRDGRGFAEALAGLEGTPIVGATLRVVNDAIAQSARLGPTLHIRGESGAGKELAARHFHASGPRSGGPFVAVNCAAIPEGVAERLLFGAVRGAYSGADVSVDGYLQAADKGTLFLDEVAELDRSVQAKLLRVIETRQVTALGASRSRSVEVGLCSATHRDLRAAVAEGVFREDLYFRLGRPAVLVPPVRERREEIAFLAFRALGAAASAEGRALGAEATFIEALLLRHWPGNVRELNAEVALSARRALAAGRAELSHDDLASEAGRAILPVAPVAPAAPVAPVAQAAPVTQAAPAAPEAVGASARSPSARPTQAEIAAALEAHQGNVSAAARALKVHRTQLRRWMAGEGLGEGGPGKRGPG